MIDNMLLVSSTKLENLKMLQVASIYHPNNLFFYTDIFFKIDPPLGSLPNC